MDKHGWYFQAGKLDREDRELWVTISWFVRWCPLVTVHAWFFHATFGNVGRD